MREVITAPDRVSHECSMCGKIEPWSENWCWYGSYRDLEDGKTILKFCSVGCKNDAIIHGKVPDDAEEAA